MGLEAAAGLLTISGLLPCWGLAAAGRAGDAAGRGVGLAALGCAALGLAGAAAGLAGAAGRAGAAEALTGGLIGWLPTGLGATGAFALGGVWGLLNSGDLGAAGLAGAAGAGGAAFFTERIALPGTGLAGAGAAGLLPFPLPRSERIFPASASLIELLWLFAAIDSFSAASSTSLFSRPRSLDSS